MSKNREIIQTSFNMKDKYEKKLYEFAKQQGASSKYIKRLIHDHMNGENTPPPVSHIMVPVIDEKQQRAIDSIDI